MSASISPLAGQARATEARQLLDVAKLIAAYYSRRPDPSVPGRARRLRHLGASRLLARRHLQRGARPCDHQAICATAREQGIDGPLFIGIDTHALSLPAFDSALEVLAANGVEVMIAKGDEYTPTPAISHAILVHNRGRKSHLADGIVVTPSHNPPDNGGFKYNPPNGGPADTDVTGWIESTANALLASGLQGRRAHAARAGAAAPPPRTSTIFSTPMSRDLANVIDLDVDPRRGHAHGRRSAGRRRRALLGAHRRALRLDLTVVSEEVDPTFSFMTRRLGRPIRMDPSSPYAMQRLIGTEGPLRHRLRLRHRP